MHIQIYDLPCWVSGMISYPKVTLLISNFLLGNNKHLLPTPFSTENIHPSKINPIKKDTMNLLQEVTVLSISNVIVYINILFYEIKD